MEFFHRAKAVRLRSQHSKFLYADEDEESVKQQGNGASAASRWTVEFVEGKPNVIRLKSSQSWKYLSASDEPFLLGWTGKRVLQASPRLKSDASVEWEPIKEGLYVKLRARRGTFLRANGTIPPWRNSVTHDMPSRSQTQDSVLWIVDVLEIDHTAEQEKKVVNDRPDLKGNDPNYSFASSGGVEEELTRTSSVNSNSGGGRIGSPAGSVRHTPSPPRQVKDGKSRRRWWWRIWRYLSANTRGGGARSGEASGGEASGGDLERWWWWWCERRDLEIWRGEASGGEIWRGERWCERRDLERRGASGGASGGARSGEESGGEIEVQMAGEERWRRSGPLLPHL